MDMKSPITAIGFSEVDEKYTIQQIVQEIVDKPTRRQASKNKSKDIIVEYVKEFAKEVYVLVRILIKSEKMKVGNIETNAQIQQCEPYVESSYILQVEELTVEAIEDEYNYYGICEEKETGIEFIFWLQNVIEYTEAASEQSDFNQVKVVGIAMEGTIVLPVEQNEDDLQLEQQEKDKIKTMLQRARQGDEEARAQLEEEEKEMDDELKERLYEEDFLTIMNGYFIPTTLVDATYAILGEIKAITHKKNSQTNEAFYVFTLDVNDMPLEVVINKNQLVGYPTVGMRFMGTCWLQGTIVTNNL